MVKKIAGLFLLHLLAGLIVILLTIKPAYDYELSNGKALLALFIPLPVSLSFFLINVLSGKTNPKTVYLTFGLFVLLLLPFSQLFGDAYSHLPQNDGFKYSFTAKQIVERETLWGSDDLIFGTTDKVYIMQPGYRYFIAGWLLFAGEENRAFQFFCMLVYMAALVLFLQRLLMLRPVTRSDYAICLFVLLSSPFVVKMILMGLGEWLAIAIFMMSMAAALSGWRMASVLLIALLPFFRQNLLLFSFFFFLWIIYRQHRKHWYLLGYLSVLLLPVYHNWYFAEQFRFFATYQNASWLSVFGFEGGFTARLVKTFLYHISLYTGVDWLSQNLWANLLSIAFIPLGTFVYIRSIFKLHGFHRVLYLGITWSAILPTLVLGWAYYPRFEWVNLMLALLFFLFYHHAQRLTEETLKTTVIT